MALTTGRGLRIAYELTGDPSGPHALIVSGLGRQLIETAIGLREMLVAAGLGVVRFDNRDVGLSTHLDGKIDLSKVRRNIDAGLAPEVPYRLEDMADDAVRVIDELGVHRAHVVGFSMGGAIGQVMAVRHPDRVATLTSISSTTGDPTVGQPDAAGKRALFTAPPPDPEAAIDTLVEARRVIASPGQFVESEARALVAAAVRRAFDPAGTGRQLAALWAAGNRTGSLRRVVAPTLVIHGDADRLVDPSGGRATAAAIRGARLVEIVGMGHDLPAEYLDRVGREILAHIVAGEESGPASRHGAGG